MRVPIVTRAVAIAAALGAVTSVSAASLVLADGDPMGSMPGDLASGPGGGSIAFKSSPATPDDGGKFTAQVDSAVTMGNSLSATGLTFWYRLTSIDQTPNGLPLFSLGVPMPMAATVALNQAPGTGNISSLGVNSGAVSFWWSVNPIMEKQVSAWQAIETTFTAYTLGTVGAIDGTSEDVCALVPAVPEPSTFAGVFALGLAGFAAYRRFRA